MCTTRLLLWKNQKGSTCYPMILDKRDSTADIFLWISNFFFLESYFTKQLQTTVLKDFYLLRMSDDHCFRRAAQGQLSQREECCNCFESIGKISQSSKRNKSICLWIFWKKSQFFVQNLQGRARVGILLL